MPDNFPEAISKSLRVHKPRRPFLGIFISPVFRASINSSARSQTQVPETTEQLGQRDGRRGGQKDRTDGGQTADGESAPGGEQRGGGRECSRPDGTGPEGSGRREGGAVKAMSEEGWSRRSLSSKLPAVKRSL